MMVFLCNQRKVSLANNLGKYRCLGPLSVVLQVVKFVEQLKMPRYLASFENNEEILQQASQYENIMHQSHMVLAVVVRAIG